MFKPFYGTCLGPCGKQNQLIPIKDGFCERCNYDRKQAKKKASGKSTAKYTYVREATGEKELFEEIAAEREWVCFVTGETLWELTPTQFMHVLPKALNKYPKYKLYKDNIVLASNEVHHKYDHTPHSTLIGEGWERLFKLRDELKEQYPNII
jgi:hypothetical protein